MMYLQQQSLGVRGCRELSNGDLSCNLGTQGKEKQDKERMVNFMHIQLLTKLLVYIGEPFTNGYNVTTHLVFHKTYMPPQHLLGYPLAWEENDVNIDIQDFAGDAHLLEKELQLHMGVMMPEFAHGPHLTFAPTGENRFER